MIKPIHHVNYTHTSERQTTQTQSTPTGWSLQTKNCEMKRTRSTHKFDLQMRVQFSLQIEKSIWNVYNRI